MTHLNLIGAGRVGKTLGRLFSTQGGCQVQSVLTRSETSTRQALGFMGAGQAADTIDSMRPAPVWMLAVGDSQIAPTAQALADSGQAPGLAFHCSGALASDQLAPLAQHGWQVASAHCLLSFAQPETALHQFPGTPCALEGDAPALAVLQPLFECIGAHCFTLAAEQKLLYHAGAVFATNFLPVLQDVAERLWQHSGMPATLAQPLRDALLHKAVANLLNLGPQGALTGPAARGDVALVSLQAQALTQWDEDVGAAYRALSRLAGRLAGQTPQTTQAPPPNT